MTSEATIQKKWHANFKQNVLSDRLHTKTNL